MKKTGIGIALILLSINATRANDGCPLNVTERLFRDFDVSWSVEKDIDLTRKSPPFFYSNQNKWRDYWSVSITVSFNADFPGNKIPAGTRFELQMEPMFPEYDGFFRPSFSFYFRELVKQDSSSDAEYRHPRSALVRVLHLKNVSVRKFEKITGLTLTCKRRG